MVPDGKGFHKMSSANKSKRLTLKLDYSGAQPPDRETGSRGFRLQDRTRYLDLHMISSTMRLKREDSGPVSLEFGRIRVGHPRPAGLLSSAMVRGTLAKI